jgi:pyruvate formate lyase activating enzyme
MEFGSDTRKGLVFDIQRFSIHDGPGIRTTVFLKGCPLRCRWCSNPESQDFTPNLMVRDSNCRGCGECARVCPEGAISFSPERGRVIDRSRCNRCMLCVDACLHDSLSVSGKEMAVGEVVDEVMRDLDYYGNSNGGVTVSGGEPLMQAPFVANLLQACKERGLHTALDTTGYVPWDRSASLEELVDLLLFDLKHLDSRKHMEAVGVPNEPILENLERWAQRTALWLRIPLITGFNDSENHIMETARLARKMRVEKVSLLPYHEGGISKSRQLGRPYGLPQGRIPSKDHLDRLLRILQAEGVRASVGD